MQTAGDVDNKHGKQLIPISCLPVETLTEIFAAAAQAASSTHTSGHAATILASTCRHWRQIALSTALLWSTIDVGNVSWITTALERAVDLPLSVYLRPDRDDAVTHDLLSTIFANLPRILSIHFEADSSGTGAFRIDTSFWKDVDWTAAKLLESLVFESIDIFEAFLDGGPPSLQTLKLHGCNFDWDDTPLSPYLKELSIQHPGEFAISQTLHHYLRYVPLLEKLELVAAVFDVAPPPDTQDRIPLPNLQHLLVGGMLDVDVQNFFGGISVPATAYISANIHIDDDDPQTPSTSLTAIQSSRPVTWDPIVLEVFMSTVYVSIKIHETIRGEQVKLLEFLCQDSSTGPGLLIENCCTVLNLDNLATLDVSAHVEDVTTEISLSFWSSIFGQLPKLRVLKARGDAAQCLVELLFVQADLLSSSDRNPLPPLSFLALEILALDGGSFSAYSTEHLVYALKARSKLGHRLNELILCIADDHQCEEVDKDALCQKNFSGLVGSVKEVSVSQF